MAEQNKSGPIPGSQAKDLTAEFGKAMSKREQAPCAVRPPVPGGSGGSSSGSNVTAATPTPPTPPPPPPPERQSGKNK